MAGKHDEWAYVEFYCHRDANAARKGLSGMLMLKGRELRVEWAKPKKVKEAKGRTQVCQAPAVAPPAGAQVEENKDDDDVVVEENNDDDDVKWAKPKKVKEVNGRTQVRQNHLSTTG